MQSSGLISDYVGHNQELRAVPNKNESGIAYIPFVNKPSTAVPFFPVANAERVFTGQPHDPTQTEYYRVARSEKSRDPQQLPPFGESHQPSVALAESVRASALSGLGYSGVLLIVALFALWYANYQV